MTGFFHESIFHTSNGVSSEAENELRNRMSELMNELGLTEERLSRITGIRQNSINPIKNNKRVPRVDTCIRIAEAFSKIAGRRITVSDIWFLRQPKDRAA